MSKKHKNIVIAVVFVAIFFVSFMSLVPLTYFGTLKVRDNLQSPGDEWTQFYSYEEKDTVFFSRGFAQARASYFKDKKDPPNDQVMDNIMSNLVGIPVDDLYNDPKYQFSSGCLHDEVTMEMVCTANVTLPAKGFSPPHTIYGEYSPQQDEDIDHFNIIIKRGNAHEN